LFTPGEPLLAAACLPAGLSSLRPMREAA
jgi:hypothetical protein